MPLKALHEWQANPKIRALESRYIALRLAFLSKKEAFMFTLMSSSSGDFQRVLVSKVIFNEPCT